MNCLNLKSQYDLQWKYHQGHADSEVTRSWSNIKGFGSMHQMIFQCFKNRSMLKNLIKLINMKGIIERVKYHHVRGADGCSISDPLRGIHVRIVWRIIFPVYLIHCRFHIMTVDDTIICQQLKWCKLSNFPSNETRNYAWVVQPSHDCWHRGISRP